MNILAVLFLLLLASTAVADQSKVFDVTNSKYGGKPDSDISKALTVAWNDACASPSTSTVLVPRGTYDLLQQTTFEGPCNAPIQFQLQGTLQAPKDRSQLDDSWVIFKTIDRLTLSGGGTFDGHGELSWKKEHHDSTPVDIRFRTITNSIISDVTFMDSAKFHSSIHESNNVTFQRVTITAPEDSPNTDGIHIASSTKITVSDSHIATGDGCISIGDGSNQILVSNITCGPGHGISIGSLGKYPNEQPVVGVTVKNCTLTGTTNGARIKTWPDSPSSSVAKDILYQDLIMVDVKNPILIDQNYCDKGKGCDQNVPSIVQISDVRFKNIKGSSSSPVAVKLDCSHNNPCLNVELSDIDLTYSGDKEDKLTSECNNVEPRITAVTDALACANLGDIPVHNSPTPSTSPPLAPAPVQQPPPPPPVKKHHSPKSPPPSPSPLVSPPPPSVVTTTPPTPEVTTPPPPPDVTTPPPSPPEVTTPPPSPPEVTTPPPPPPVVTTPPPPPPVVTTPPPPPPVVTTLPRPPSPEVAYSTPPIIMVYGDPYYSLPRPYGPGFRPTPSAPGNVPKQKPRAIVIGIIVAVIAGAGLISMWYQWRIQNLNVGGLQFWSKAKNFFYKIR